MVDERLAGRAAAPLGRGRAAGCGDLSQGAPRHAPIARRGRRRSASVASSSAARPPRGVGGTPCASTNGRRLRRARPRPPRVRRPVSTSRCASTPAVRPTVSIAIASRASSSARSRSPRASSTRIMPVQRADLVLGHVHDLAAGARRPRPPRRACRSRGQLGDVERVRARRSGSASATLRAAASASSGLPERAVHVDEARSRRWSSRPRARRPARAVDTASLALAGLEGGVAEVRSSPPRRRARSRAPCGRPPRPRRCAPRWPARRRGRARPRPSRARARSTRRSWSTASSAPGLDAGAAGEPQQLGVVRGARAGPSGAASRACANSPASKWARACSGLSSVTARQPSIAGMSSTDCAGSRRRSRRPPGPPASCR